MDPSLNPALLSRSEAQRPLPTTAFAPSSELVIEVPCDTVIKRMRIRFSGNIVTTFASGTPVADQFSTVSNLVTNVRLVIDGATTLKSVSPYFQQQMQLLTSTVLAERKSSAAASAAAFNNPVADAGFTYGSTTNVTTVAESFDLFFEVPFARKEDKYATLLNLKGRSTCELKFVTGAYANLLGFGNTAPVVFSAASFNLDVVLIEDRSIPREQVFLDYVQSNQTYQYSSQASGVREKLPVSQFLMAISLLTRDGAAGSSTTASGRVANSNVIGNVQLQLNGMTTIKNTTFAQLQSENRARYGVQAPFASSVSRLDGYAHMDFLQDGMLDTAVDCRRSQGIDNVELVFDLQAVSYTNPVTLQLETHEYRVRS